jgi:hypothetical protein
VPHDESMQNQATLLDPRRRGRSPLVRNDEPTLPEVRSPSAKPPVWPLPVEHARRPRRRGSAWLGWVQLAGIGASGGLLLCLLVLLALFSLTKHNGPRSSGRPAGQSSPAMAADTAVPSHTTISPWLQVAPASVQFGCADHQRTQLVVLENRGAQQVHWQAVFSSAADQSAVSVSPGNGDLGPGESTAIQLQSTTSSSGGQEAIRFVEGNSRTGPPATLTVTTATCS